MAWVLFNARSHELEGPFAKSAIHKLAPFIRGLPSNTARGDAV